MTIGDVTLENNLILGPMAGVTDLPFRLLCKEMGVGLVCMEMVSAKALSYNNKNTESLLNIDQGEMPVSLQLFGHEPEVMAEQARRIEELPFAILDINMGCPMPKIVNNGDGSALMKDPLLAGRMIEETARAIKKPVTVKIRKGFDEEHVNAPELARIAEESGAAAVAVHARTSRQKYDGAADWDVIAAVKDAVKIPVIGNGDIRCAADVERMSQRTGCDGFMIARGARGNPWIFREILENAPPPTPEEMKAMLLRHGRMLCEYKGNRTGLCEIRKHAAWYTSGYKNSSRLREHLAEVVSLESLEELLDEYIK